ncbi:MAG: hypothetical protein FWE07_05200 [Turicibacter sp.]|nr:hypothetical protein [Turicibacter sp.]
MKNLIKDPMRLFGYTGALLSYVLSFWLVSFFLLHQSLELSALFIYFGNIGLMIVVLTEDKLTDYLVEWLYQQQKRDGWLKRELGKRLAENRWKPSMKAALYLYYMICLVFGRALVLSGDYAFAGSEFVGSLRSYFSEMYYVLILFLGADKFKAYIFKESTYRDRYYRRYGEASEETES